VWVSVVRAIPGEGDDFSPHGGRRIEVEEAPEAVDDMEEWGARLDQAKEFGCLSRPVAAMQILVL
jgi:hypothetical protein